MVGSSSIKDKYGREFKFNSKDKYFREFKFK